MSILDTFYFVFKGDTKDLDKKLDQVDDAAKRTESQMGEMADKTEMALSGFGDTGPLGHLIGMLSSGLSPQLKIAVVSIGALAASMALLRSSYVMGKEMGEFANSVGLGTKRYTQLELAARSAGVEVEKFRETATKLAEESKKPLDKALQDYANKLGKMSRDKALMEGAKLGIDQATLQLLMQGGKAWSDMVAKQEEAAADVAEVKRAYELINKSVLAMGVSFVGLQADVANAFDLKVITDVIDWVAKFMDANSEAIAQFIATIGDVFGFLWAVASPILDLVGALFSLFSQLFTMAVDGWGAVGSATEGFGQILQEVVQASVDGLRFIIEMLQDTESAANFLAYGFYSAMESMGAGVNAFGQTALKIFNLVLEKAIGMINNMIKAANDVAGKVGVDLGIKEIEFKAKELDSGRMEKWAQEKKEANLLSQSRHMSERSLAEERRKSARKAKDDQENADQRHLKLGKDAAKEQAKAAKDASLSLEQYFALWAAGRGQSMGLAATADPETLKAASALKGAKDAVATSARMPVPSERSIAAAGNSRSVSVTTGPITINTTSTDPQAINSAISSNLEEQLKFAVNNFDNGVEI